MSVEVRAWQQDSEWTDLDRGEEVWPGRVQVEDVLVLYTGEPLICLAHHGFIS